MEFLSQALRRHALQRPGATACVYLDEDLAAQTLTYAELDRDVRAAAAHLSAAGVAGRPVLLLHPTGPDFARAFLACLHAGAIAVPAPVPGAGAGSAERVEGIIADAGIAFACTTPGLRRTVGEFLPASVRLIDLHAPAPVPAGEPTPGDIAFLQYTSGSTTAPRGVLVGNDNLAHNLAHLARSMPVEGPTVFGGWLPHHHDMGLIGQLLFPLNEGGTSLSMAPTTFVKGPHRWLRALSAHRATHSTAPDFGYDLCVRLTTDDELDGVDLSAWRYAVNGAEPIRAATVAEFTERFARWGLRPQTLCPAYGLAEATLLVTSTPGDREPATTTVDGRRLVSSGRATPRVEVTVVDPDTRRVLPDRSAGEIWLRGGSVARGYLGRPELTARVFEASTADGDGPYLRTGDLGFLDDGELYVAGRSKDLIILSGRNFHPGDIEHAVAGAHDALAGLRGAAFSVATDREHCVLVHELRPARLRGITPAELAERMRGAAGRAIGVPVANIVLVRPGGVPRTTSGKIRRARLRELFMAGAVAAVYEELEPAVRARFREAAAGA